MEQDCLSHRSQTIINKQANMTETSNIQFKDEEFTLVRTPLDPKTGKARESCQYALYPGLTLAESEPELVVLLYDSVRNMHPDTGMLLYPGRDGADPHLNRKWKQRLLERWRALGKPTVFIVSPEDMKFFRGSVPEIRTISIYEELLSCNVSGGCNRELYRLAEPEQFGFEEELRKLADMMGAVLYDPSVNTDIPPSDAGKIPFLTSSIDVRNAMKKQGFEAVHILELVFGMGRSNRHLAHVHAEGADHDHHAAPQVRETAMSDEEQKAQEGLFDETIKKQNRRDLYEPLLSFFWNE